MPQDMDELKSTIEYDLPTIPDGKIVGCDDFCFFREGNKTGVALDTGEKNFNLGGIGIAKAFELKSRVGLLYAPGNFLTLTVDCAKNDLKNPVKNSICAKIFAYFVHRNNRESLFESPKTWARNMIDVLGNAVNIEKPCPYIAEMFAVNELLRAKLMQDPENEYCGPDGQAHDIETTDFSLEVKSHLQADRTDAKAELVISSPDQLRRSEDRKPLYVVYFPMGKTGPLSLKSSVDEFVKLTGRRDIALHKLENSGSGFTENDLVWEDGFHIQGEPRVYEVDQDFPKITEIPTGITELVYHVSLNNLRFCTFKEFIEAKRTGRNPEFKTAPAPAETK